MFTSMNSAVLLIMITISQLFAGIAQAATPEELKKEKLMKAYVDQRFGMFIHFNMSTFARQPFLTSGGEHEIGQMPLFDDVDISPDDEQISPFEAEQVREFRRMFFWYRPYKLPTTRGMFECPRSNGEGEEFVFVADPTEETQCPLDKKRFAAADTDGNGVLIKKEYDEIREHVGKFYPTALNVEQWAEAAQAAGVSYAILTTKHHGGFGLWDSKAQYKGRNGEQVDVDYDIGSTKWAMERIQRGENADIVDLFVKAFRNKGIKVGLYWSMPERTHGADGNIYGFHDLDEGFFDFSKITEENNLVFKVVLSRPVEEEDFKMIFQVLDTNDTWDAEEANELIFNVPSAPIESVVRIKVPKEGVKALRVTVKVKDIYNGEYIYIERRSPITFVVTDSKGNPLHPDTYGIPSISEYMGADEIPTNFVQAQLKELLDNYGTSEDPISVLWIDNWDTRKDGWIEFEAVPYEPIRELLNKEEYSNTLVFLNAHPWNRVTETYDTELADKTDIQGFETNFEGLPLESNERYAEVYTSIRANETSEDESGSLWFYHEEGSDELKNLDDIVEELHNVNARKATYLLNVTPDKRGVIPENQEALLQKIGEVKDLENINRLVNFYVTQYNAPPTALGDCPNNDNKNKYGFKAVLRNISGRDNPTQARVLSLLHVRVGTLEFKTEPDTVTNGNVVLLMNGDYVKAGGQFMVAGGEGLIGAGLTPQSEIEVPFTVCLGSTDPFQLFVDVKGVVSFDDTAPAMIQGSLGNKPESLGNFEMIVREGDQLCHWWRKNDDESNKWSKSECFGEDVKSAPAFIQSSFGENDNFEVIYRTTKDTLRHYWRDNNDLSAPKWKLGNWSFGKDVASAPALIQSEIDRGSGSLEVVYRDSANRLRHWWRDESTEEKEWKPGTEEGKPFGENVTSAPAMIQSTLHNNLDVVVRESNRLRHYYRIEEDDGKGGKKQVWKKGPKLFGENASSAPAFIQSNIGVGSNHGNFEVIVREGGSKLLREGGRLRHYWCDAKPVETEPNKPNKTECEWHTEELLPTREATSAPALIQSKLEDLRNFEVVVREEDKLIHYFRDNDDSPGFPWDTSGEITE